MPDKMKVVMAGVENWGRMRRGWMRDSGLYEIVAAYDYNETFLDKCIAEENCAGTANYEKLLETDGAKAVIISTGAKFHADQVLKALEAGLHVLVEKPLCCTPAELEKILVAQKKTGLVVHVGHKEHETEPVSQYIKNEIDSGRIGKVAAFEKTKAHSGGFVIKPGDWRDDPKTNPGGMLFQCGVHSLFELQFYFGPIKKIYSLMRYNVHTTQTADTALCALEFENGVTGTLHAYHVTAYRHTFSLFGTKKNIYVNERFYDEGTTINEQVLSLDDKKQEMQPVDFGGEYDHIKNVQRFYECVAANTPQKTNLQAAAAAVGAVFAAEESAKTGKEVWLS